MKYPKMVMLKFFWNRTFAANNAQSVFIRNWQPSPVKPDPVTYNMVVSILSDEVEHEEDLQSLAEDIELMIARR